MVSRNTPAHRSLVEPSLSTAARVLLSFSLTALVAGAHAQVPLALGVGALVSAILLLVWSWTVAELMVLDRAMPTVRWPETYDPLSEGEDAALTVQLDVPERWRGLTVVLRPVVCRGLAVEWPDGPLLLDAARVAVDVRVTALQVGSWPVPGVALVGSGPLGLICWDRRARSNALLHVLPALWLQRRGVPKVDLQGSPGGSAARKTRPGRGLEDHDLRPWQPGDGPRDVAWSASLRTGSLWVRRRAREEEAPLWVVLERSPRAGAGGPSRVDSSVLNVVAALYRIAEAAHRPCGWIVVEDERCDCIPLGLGRRREALWAQRLLMLGNPSLTTVSDGEEGALRHAVAEDIEAWDRLHFMRSESEGLTHGLDSWLKLLERRWPAQDLLGAPWPPREASSVARYAMRWGLEVSSRPVHRPGARHRAQAAALAAMKRSRSPSDAVVIWLGEAPGTNRMLGPPSPTTWTWGLMPLQPWVESKQKPWTEEDAVAWLHHREERDELQARARALHRRGQGAVVLDPTEAPERLAARLLQASPRSR